MSESDRNSQVRVDSTDAVAVSVAHGGPRRYASLDGLRGIASLTVVLHHALLTQEPVRMYWTGGAAVFVFFVLSGFVLSLPFLRATPTSWRSYYPARLVRLYLPVWGAVVLATVLIIVVPRAAQPGQSSWVAAQGPGKVVFQQVRSSLMGFSGVLA